MLLEITSSIYHIIKRYHSQVTSVFAAICMRNFDKGLKPFVQRGRNKSEKDLELNNQKTIDEWKIDDI